MCHASKVILTCSYEKQYTLPPMDFHCRHHPARNLLAVITRVPYYSSSDRISVSFYIRKIILQWGRSPVRDHLYPVCQANNHGGALEVWRTKRSCPVLTVDRLSNRASASSEKSSFSGYPTPSELQLRYFPVSPTYLLTFFVGELVVVEFPPPSCISWHAVRLLIHSNSSNSRTFPPSHIPRNYDVS